MVISWDVGCYSLSRVRERVGVRGVEATTTLTPALSRVRERE
jgi:hypothetical protein